MTDEEWERDNRSTVIDWQKINGGRTIKDELLERITNELWEKTNSVRRIAGELRAIDKRLTV